MTIIVGLLTHIIIVPIAAILRITLRDRRIGKDADENWDLPRSSLSRRDENRNWEELDHSQPTAWRK